MIYIHVLNHGTGGVGSLLDGGKPLLRSRVMPIRIRTSDKWSHRRNSLKRQRSWHMVRKLPWRVIRTEIGGSGSYADRLKLS